MLQIEQSGIDAHPFFLTRSSNVGEIHVLDDSRMMGEHSSCRAAKSKADTWRLPALVISA